MDSKKMTLSRIAAELGVSMAAVSYALNDRPGVSAELRSRVRQLAKRWNYQSPAVRFHRSFRVRDKSAQ